MRRTAGSEAWWRTSFSRRRRERASRRAEPAGDERNTRSDYVEALKREHAPRADDLGRASPANGGVKAPRRLRRLLLCAIRSPPRRHRVGGAANPAAHRRRQADGCAATRAKPAVSDAADARRATQRRFPTLSTPAAIRTESPRPTLAVRRPPDKGPVPCRAAAACRRRARANGASPCTR